MAFVVSAVNRIVIEIGRMAKIRTTRRRPTRASVAAMAPPATATPPRSGAEGTRLPWGGLEVGALPRPWALRGARGVSHGVCEGDLSAPTVNVSRCLCLSGWRTIENGLLVRQF